MGKTMVLCVNDYFVFVYSCPSLSSLGWSGVGLHEGFVDGLF
jgi:hypothetical protein